MSAPFADRLIDVVRRKNTPLCVGLDPFPDKIPALFGDAREEIGAIERFCEAIVGVAAQHAGVFKPQVGLFEPFGPEGVRVAQEGDRGPCGRHGRDPRRQARRHWHDRGRLRPRVPRTRAGL
jgi:hypothetical protein